LINRQPDLEVCGEAASEPQALELIGLAQPHVAVVDISLKNIKSEEPGVAAEIMRTLVKECAVCLTMACTALWLQEPGRLHAEGIFGVPPNDTTLTEYDGLQLISRVHADRFFVDHQRWGFFRLGLFPIAVVEGVEIQVRSASCLTNALADLNSWHPSSAGARRLELRNLEISLLGEKEPRLHAAIARVGQGGALELSNVSVAVADGTPVSLAKATLQISGSDSGRLRWRDGGSGGEFFVFKTLENQNQKP
jgi:hypothetical protein